MQPLDPKILGQRLQVERKARGLTQSDLAGLLGLARTTWISIEKGERALAPVELERLSTLWNISLSDLVRARPVVEPLAPQLRSAASGGLKESELQQLNEAAERLRRLGEYSLELEAMLERPLTVTYPPVYEATAPVEVVAADIANRERHRLAVGDGPLPHLRSILENDVGLRIYLLSLPSRIAGMFAYDVNLGGCIALNVSHPAERRLWTLAHEYWHFLADRYRSDICLVSTPRRQNESERLADAFAAHFLMPEAGLKRRFYELKATKSAGLTPGDLLHLKRQYGVAFQALMLRLEELKLLRAGTWQHLFDAGFRVGEAEAMVGLPKRKDNEERLPLRYRVLAVEAYDQGEISEGQLKRFLDCDEIEARRIVADFSREYSVDEDGAWGELELAPGEPLVAAF